MKLLFVLNFITGTASSDQYDCYQLRYHEIHSACTKAHAWSPGQTTWKLDPKTKRYRYKPLRDGYSYQGIWRDGKPHGIGIYVLENSFEYQGDMKKGLPNGTGKKIFKSGKIILGNFENGVAKGSGKIFFPDMSIYIGAIKNNLPNGTGTLTDASKTVFKGDFIQGKMHGNGTAQFENGFSYVGSFENTQFSGYGTLFTDNGTHIQSANWKNGLIDGEGIIKYADGSSYEGKMVGINRGGQGKYIFKNGNYYSGYFIDGGLKGNAEYVYFGADKDAGRFNVYNGPIVDGKRHGHGTSRLTFGDAHFSIIQLRHTLTKDNWAFEEAITFEGTYNEDERVHGTFTFENGDTLKVVSFEDGIEGELLIKNSGSRATGKWTRPNKLSRWLLTGNVEVLNREPEIYVGELKNGRKSGLGIYRSNKNTLYLKRGEVYFGYWHADVKRGDGYVINPQTQQVKFCKFEPLNKPKCKSNSFLEWLIPVRGLLGISDFLVPNLKREIENLEWLERSFLGLSDWSFHTFAQLLFTNIKLTDNLHLNDPTQIDSLLHAIYNNNFSIKDEPFFYFMLVDLDNL